ncbi:restriction endonuclease [Evansella tamaricis]|uniref:Restriction endonuclease n=1 Tax=Evansella tamaricis TaxID=2069301 RepID=A0ABS6JKA1_9BACI|nr:restriction endonuclease [Evansella tamaricis]MBU9714122.1 restriction endonuclease [Evansella tamaricis]
MARRKSAAKREDEFIDTVLKLSSFGVFLISFMITKSLSYSLVLAGFGLVLSIIFLIYRKIKYTKKIKRSKIQDIDKMSGVQFEYYLKLFFQKKDYKVKETKTTGDYGADLVLIKDNKKIIVQAKRYNSRVGIKAVQEAVSAVAYYNASEAWVVTNNEFTGAAIELARSNKVRLIERDELLGMVSELQGDVPSNLVNLTNSTELKELCKRCGSELMIRKGKRGDFYGCSSFPKCRYTQDLESIT